MRLIAIGDIHISDNIPYSSQTNDRLQNELMGAMNQVMVVCKEEDINHVVVAGDIFDRIDISPREMEAFKKFVRMAQDHDVQLFMISGNHEVDEEGNAVIKGLAELMGFKHAATPTLITPPCGHKWMNVSVGHDFELCLFDYHHLQQELFDDIRKALKASETDTRIFVGHQPVETMLMSNSIACTYGVPAVWFDSAGIIGKNFNISIMGDFHRTQYLPDGGIYTGSLIQNSFKDEGSTPSYHIVDTVKKTITSKPIKCPRFHVIRIVEGRAGGPDYDALTKGGYIRISMIGTKEFVEGFNLDELKEKIIDEYSPIKLMLANPTITCSIPKVEDMFVTRLMSDEELVERIIKKKETELPEKMLYEAGVKYLRRAREDKK